MREIAGKRFSKGVILFLATLLALFCGVSLFGESQDYNNYYIIFNQSSFSDFFYWSFTYEPFFYLINTLFNSSGFPFIFFYIFVIFLAVILKMFIFSKLTKNYKSLLLLLVFYFSYLFWLHDYTQIRLALALSFLLIMFYSDRRSNWIYGLLAVFTHASVLVVLVLWYFAKNLWFRVALISTFALLMGAVIYSGGLVEHLLSIQNPESFPFLYKLTDYAYLFKMGGYAELNIWSPAPFFQSLILLLTYRLVDEDCFSEYFLSVVGVSFFYSLSEIPVLAVRFYELFIIFFLIFIVKIWPRLGILKVLIPFYCIIGLRSVFFSSSPIIRLSGL